MWSSRIKMFELKLILLLCFVALANCQCSGNCPQTQCSSGSVRGSYMYTRTNRQILAFRGIRYAKPPVDSRRFAVPEPIDPWSDIFDATMEGPSCPRLDNPELCSEDCLRLNVYTTCLPGMPCTQNRSVIVYFHPGAFYEFSSQSSVFGPQYLLDQDIVLVTVNYRLGSLGFMATGDARAPGNLGLKDQVAALRWIQKNIASFGGNPNSVTITGYSAGSWSVILHMMSPMSAGLFHRAIAMSGSPTSPQPLPTEQMDLCIRQARYVGCPTNSLDEAFECLRTVPYQNLSASLPKFSEWYGDPVLVWSPVVEPPVPGVERFLTAQPVDLIRQKKFHHVPLIIGICKDEFASAPLTALEQALRGNNVIYDNITANWEYAAPISFLYERDTPNSRYVSRELKRFYLNDEPLTARNGRNLGLIYADSIIGWPTHRGALLFAQYSQAPVYNYQFTYQGRFSYRPWSDTKKPYGVVHHDELQYLFYMRRHFPFFTNTDSFPEVKMLNVWTSIWKNFAQTGYPMPKSDKLFEGVTWTRLDAEKENYLEIGDKLTMKNKMFPERYALWERLFPLTPLIST